MILQAKNAKESSPVGESIFDDLWQGTTPTINLKNHFAMEKQLMTGLEESSAFIIRVERHKDTKEREGDGFRIYIRLRFEAFLSI